MKRLLLAAGVLGALVMLQSSTWAAPKTPLVTRDNFGGLVFGWESLTSQIQRTYSVNREGKFFHRHSAPSIREGLPQRGQFSEFEFNELLKAINQAHLPSLNVKYSPHPQEGKAQSLQFFCAISTDRKPPQISTSPINEATPSEYLEFWEALDTIFQAKSRSQNLQLLVLETTGGFAGIRSRIEVRATYEKATNVKYTLHWEQTVGERDRKRDATITSDEQFQLKRLLLLASLPKLDEKNFQQENLSDGFNEVLTVEMNGERKFTVSNYGDQAPPAYFTITRYLNELKTKKFNDQ